MKMTIAWHQHCLINLKGSLERYEQRLEELQGERDRCKERYDSYSRQISEALRLGKDGFDEGRFLKPKSTPTEV